MANIRIVRLSVKSSSSILVTFTSSLSELVGLNNIIINGLNGSSADLTILSTSVSGKDLTINVKPMVSRAYYRFTLFSTDSQRVVGAKGEYFIEDGATNVVFFNGPQEDNIIRDNIIAELPGIYSKEPGTLLYDSIDSGAREMLANSHLIGEVGSANYVSIDIIDEEKTRGAGPSERFNKEGVFKLLRVGSTTTGTTLEEQISYDEFPSAPVSLQQVFIDEELVSNSINDQNSFDGLTITLSKSPVIQVTSIILTQNDINYTYNISQYRYGILDSKYDSDNSYTFLDITSSQIKLTSSAIGPDFPMPQANDTLTISYYYKRVGRSTDNIILSTAIDITREVIPSVSTTFFLAHAPIINSSGDLATLNGVSWLDPAQNFSSTLKHPAFIVELRYSPTNLPKSIGQYSVNYETGQVFVYGVDGTGVDGTTIIPPVATYKYKKIYQENLDYVVYADLNEIASIPGRDLRENPVTIDFRYEDNFADGTDFNFNSHIEIINERVENRLIDNIGLRTLNGPVREVFRIYNETTGELYSPSRIVKNEVYFDATNKPKTIDVSREPIQFELVTQSQLIIVDIITLTPSINVFKINLETENVVSADNNFIGASFNTSIEFSDKTIFIRELYYDIGSLYSVNIARLEQIGDYVIDYEFGVVYLAVATDADVLIGDASYRYNKALTRNMHIIRATDVYKSASVILENTEIFTVGDIEDNLVMIDGLEHIGESVDINGDPLVVGSGLIVETQKDIYKLGKIFQVTDLKTKFDPINFGENATISSSYLNTITLSSSGTKIEDTNSIPVQFDEISRYYIEAERLQDLFDDGLAQLVSAINVIDEATGEDYFSQGTTGYIDAATNRIYLPIGVGAVGTIVNASYKAVLREAAAVLVEYTTGNIFIDYTYTPEEIIISYEYGDNVIDWSISNALYEDDTYYVSYRYGALRDSLRDNFGVLTGIEELSTISDDLDREVYRSALKGALQSFPKGPTVPSVKELVKAFTQIEPNIIESIFLEWVLGRDYLNLRPLLVQANTIDEMPTYAPGKFGKGILMNLSGQTATLPANSNLSLSEGTWECFIVPEWDGTANDADIILNILFDGESRTEKIFIGSGNTNPTEIPFTLNREDPYVLGTPSYLHTDTGYFIWYDIAAKKWRVRVRAPITEERVFSGNITSSGEFYNVRVARTAGGDADYEDATQQINETNDILRSTREKIYFSFTVDSNDNANMSYDSHDSYGASYAGFDGIDFVSDEVHYLFDTSSDREKGRMSLFKDGQGHLKYRICDSNGSVRLISTDVSNWLHSEVHHVAVSWKINTIEQKDEMHLFVDGVEVPNTYRFGGYLNPISGAVFMDEAYETLISSVLSPTVGGFDLVTVTGSNIVTSSTDFISSGVTIGSRFLILESTDDGLNTQTYPYVYVRSLPSSTSLELEDGNGSDYDAYNSLSSVGYSINPISLRTLTSPQIEKIKVFSVDSYGVETELRSPNAISPDYAFSQDGYLDYVTIYNGLDIGNSAIAKTYGLNMSRHKQHAYIWSDGIINIINTKMPVPTSISRINVTKVLVTSTVIEAGAFSVIATNVGGHFLPTLNSNLDFCQPSNTVTGRRLTVILRGENIDFDGINKFAFVGETSDGMGFEELVFTGPGEMSTTRYFIRIDDAVASFTPIDLNRTVGTVEVKETLPLNFSDNAGDYAQIYLSVQQAVGSDGVAEVGTAKITDVYARFDADDIGKTFNITSPLEIAGVYTISDVDLDPSATIKDSNTVILSGVTWADAYADVRWQLINTSFGDSGFANGLITLEIAGSGGLPFLLNRCWYEIDFPTFLRMPWEVTPDLLYIGSNNVGEKQVGAVIDELRILNELSVDTGLGESAPSSGRSITTDASAVREYSPTAQTLVLMHFEDDNTNYAPFYNSYSKAFRQCSNSINENFGQSGVFNTKNAYKVDNKNIFNNNKGTIEFWVSPILDTYNDPTERYYIDLSPEQITTADVITTITVYLPSRARSVSSVTISGSDSNYYTGGSLSTNGFTVTLGRPLPIGITTVTVRFVPITSQGDRFSIFKDDSNHLVFYVSASGVEFQITCPVYWKKNSWHRVFAEWSLNNVDNQDRLVLMVDGTEAGIIRYGTGLLYGSGLVYGQQNIWGSADVGTASARNIVADINLLDIFNTIYIGADYTEELTALARIDNVRISSEPRAIIYMGGTGPGRLIGKDLLYSSNINMVHPVVSDAITRFLLDFDTDQKEVEYLAVVRNKSRGIFDFYVEVIDTFELADTALIQELIVNLINRLKPAHTRAFVSFTK